MSNDAIKWAWIQECRPAEKLILILLADHHNLETSRLNPGLSRMIERSGLSRQGVVDQLASLEKRGLLLVERSKGAVNNYRLPVNHVDQSTTLTSQPPRLPLVNLLDYHQSTTLTGPVNHVDLNRNEPEDEPEIKPGREKAKSKRAKKPKIVPQISERGFSFADWFRKLVPDVRLETNWRENWAKCYDELIRLDSRTPETIAKVCQWGRSDNFWSGNFLTPLKLRDKDRHGVKYFDVIFHKMKSTTSPQSPLTAMPTATADPEGWREYLDSRKAEYAPYGTARGWMKEEFHAGWKPEPTK